MKNYRMVDVAMLKKAILLAVMAAALGAGAADAQLTGGGQVLGPTVGADQVSEASGPVSKLMLRVGRATASGAYGTLPDQRGYAYYSDTALESAFETGSGAVNGYFVELSRIQYFANPHPMAALGLETSLSGAFVNIDWAEIQKSDTVDDLYPDAILDIQFGPAVSVQPIPELSVDLSASVGYGLVGGSEFTHSDVRTSTADLSIHDHSTPSTGISKGIGLGVRFGPATLAWRWHSVDAPRTRTYDISNYTTGFTDEIEYSTNVPASTTRLSIGLAF